MSSLKRIKIEDGLYILSISGYSSGKKAMKKQAEKAREKARKRVQNDD